MRASTLANQYVAEQAPWVLVKTDRDRAATVLFVALRLVDSLKTLLAPFLPFTSQRVHELLGYEGWIAGRSSSAPRARTGRTFDARGADRRLRELGRVVGPE
jgi:methionyl-tRNA synthetase